MNNTVGILDLFEFKKPIDDNLVPGIRKDTYFVTAQGEVSMKKRVGYDTDTRESEYEYVPIGSTNEAGYSKFSVRCEDGCRKTLTTHKIIAQAYLPPLPDGTDIKRMGIKFKDGDRHNLRASNLEWVTRNEQLVDARDSRDANTPRSNALFSNDEVHIICQMLEDGFAITELLRFMGLPTTESYISQVSKIKCGITWKHISKDYNFPNKR